MLFISPPFGNYLTFLPFTTPIKGSYTIEYRPGLLGQIYETLQYSIPHTGWLNRIGLRNPGIDSGIKTYTSKSVLSIAFLQKKIPNNFNIEINLSCPNADILYTNQINKFINQERKWCIVKLSPLDNYQKIDKLYEMGFRQFHCCNTYPTKLGGLSGPFLYPFVKDKIKYIKNKYNDAEVIAGGGIQNIETLNKYKKWGQTIFLLAHYAFIL